MKIKQDAGKSMSQQKGNLKNILRQMTMKKNYKKINEIYNAKKAVKEGIKLLKKDGK